MRYSIVNIADGRVVYKSKKYDRYYVRAGWDNLDYSDDVLEYKTNDYNEAKTVLESTKKHWGGIDCESWSIVNHLGEVII